MKIDNQKFRLPKGKYFETQDHKNMIMLHFTAGSTSSGAFASWMQQPIQIGTPYIVDPDGTVFEVFDPKYWGYHLGVTGPKAQNHKHDKRSVAIETVNVGPLKLVGDSLCFWANNFQAKYCHVSETEKYVKTVPYRGYEYYATFTDAQKASLLELVKKISSDFSIPMTMPPQEKLMEFDLDFFDNWVGIASHQNFRNDKFDTGPAYPYNIFNTKS